MHILPSRHNRKKHNAFKIGCPSRIFMCLEREGEREGRKKTRKERRKEGNMQCRHETLMWSV